MAALAVYLKESGVIVQGSDIPEVFPTDAELSKAGISVLSGFDPDHIVRFRPDVVYYTGAHGGRDNPEVVKAVELGLPVYPHGQGLGELMKGKRQIVVAGSHGKTTTSAMIAAILSHARIDPSYAIGCGAISGSHAAGHFGKSEWFVAEGDEYITDPGHDTTPRFMWLDPEILVVTNIDFDHPDAYQDLDCVKDAFVALQHKSKFAVVNIDDKNSQVLLGELQCTTYGYSPRADIRIQRVNSGYGRMFFTLGEGGMTIGEFAIKVPGRHNVLNAAAAAVAAHVAGVDWEKIREGLLTFTGTKRRFENIGEVGGASFYDDYAHHPAEVSATLRAARAWFPDRRIIAVFQPHTFSRTRALLSEFSRAFSDADIVVLTDIYASAREHDTLGIDGTTLVHEMAAHHAHVLYGKTWEEVAAHLQRELHAGDVVVCMGAGDIYAHEHMLVHAQEG